jgi:hypothetical protein
LQTLIFVATPPIFNNSALVFFFDSSSAFYYVLCGMPPFDLFTFGQIAAANARDGCVWKGRLLILAPGGIWQVCSQMNGF